MDAFAYALLDFLIFRGCFAFLPRNSLGWGCVKTKGERCANLGRFPEGLREYGRICFLVRGDHVLVRVVVEHPYRRVSTKNIATGG